MKTLQENLSSIQFDDATKTIIIKNGSVGTYNYKDITKCQILYEHARYKGKSPMFSHQVLVSIFNSSLFIEMKKIYVGLEICLNNEKIYTYISEEPVVQHNKQFKEDVECAKCIKEKIDEIIKRNKL